MATPYPLGLRGKQTSTARSDCMKLVKQLDIKVYNPGVTGGPRSRAESGIDWITYYETLDALVRHAFPTVKDSAMHGLEVVSESLTSIEKQLALKKDAELKRSIVQQQQQAGGLMAMRSESSELGLLLPTTPVGELYPVVRLQQQFRASAEKRKERNRRQRRLINDTGAIDPPAEMAPRTGASTVIIKSRLVVFGGLGPGDRLLKDCWELLTGPGTWVDRSASVPPELEPRFGHTAAAFGRNKMVINGGQGTHGRLSDVWEVDLADYSWRQLVADTSTAAQQRAMAGAPQERAQNGTPAQPRNGEAGARADALGELPLWIQNEIVSPSSADEPAEQAALELQRVWRGTRAPPPRAPRAPVPAAEADVHSRRTPRLRAVQAGSRATGRTTPCGWRRSSTLPRRWSRRTGGDCWCADGSGSSEHQRADSRPFAVGGQRVRLQRADGNDMIDSPCCGST